MKSLRLFFAVLFAASLNLQANTGNQNFSPATVQSAKTETFKVWGKCEMCKARIEKAARAEGAANADWDIKTRMLTVTYDPAKTGKDALCKKLAAVGHDTEKYRAPDDVYAKLPSCCHYERANKQ
ncbi:MAG TPA: ATPase [Bacteroidales bacterium]|jgi:mercuric ion binding protein|nr:ATPase [Bacteroidales bacterium]